MKSVNFPSPEGHVRIDVAKVQHRARGAGQKKHESPKDTIFRPYGSSEKRRESGYLTQVHPHRPERKLTLFALRLAVLEKAATGFGALGFVWATVVLLGGFASSLKTSDFWYVTVILLIEGARIFSRSHELEWQNQTTWTVSHAGIRYLKRKLARLLRDGRKAGDDEAHQAQPKSSDDNKIMVRTRDALDSQLIPHTGWAFVLGNVNKALYWLQLLSAASCVGLSLRKLIKRDYGIEAGDGDKNNLLPSLILFYSLALAEGLLFLIEKAYWEWEVSCCRLLQHVNEECKLGSTGLVSVRRFFYDAYSRCVYGSIFDGLKMDMVTFAMKLLDSLYSDEQLVAATILRQFATNEFYASDTLQKIGIEVDVIERLVEILNWSSPEHEEIRESAALILLKLAEKEQNSLRVAEISGAMESISSLLQTTRNTSDAADEIGEEAFSNERVSNYDNWKFNNLGLGILKMLARDPGNCAKIGNTRGLLPKIIDFAHVDEKMLEDESPEPYQVLTVERALQLLKLLTSTTGETGERLRQEISEIVFTVSNLRKIIRHGEKHPGMQKLSIQILTFLALEDDATEKIGGTGGVLKALFRVFFTENVQQQVQTAAGEALAMLALESINNCHRILNLQVLEKLVQSLEVPLLYVAAARILRNLCAYAPPEELRCQHETIKASAPVVLKTIQSEEGKLQEVMIGLGAYVFKLMTPEESKNMFIRAMIGEDELAKRLFGVLNKYQKPSIKVPRMRRFTVELMIWMMEYNPRNVKTLCDLGVGKELENVLDTTGELENYDIFSGAMGMTSHPTTMHPLVEAAIKLLDSK